MKKNNPSEELIANEDGGEWLTTYADLMTLLLVFFVLLFSLSTFKVEKYEELLKSIRVNPGTGQPTASLIEFMELPEAIETELSIEQFTGLKTKKTNKPGVEQKEEEILNDINQFITQKRLGKHIALEILDGKIVIRVRGKVLFRSGKADLSPSAEPILNEITSIISEYQEYSVNIKGHTDNVPISTTKFESNWDLSAIRATAVLKYLIKNGVPPKRLTATGFGDLFPIVPNNSERNKATNRRVEFVLEKDNQ